MSVNKRLLTSSQVSNWFGQNATSSIPIPSKAYTNLMSSYDSIATANGTGSASSVTFSNIPQTYKHLQVRCFVRTAYAASQDTFYMYNYDNQGSLTNSAYHYLYGTGVNAMATGGTGNTSSVGGFVPGNTALANTYGIVIVDILDYSNNNKNKTVRSLMGWDDNGTTTSGNVNVGLFSNLPVALGTTAVSGLTILFNGNITTNSKFALYGIR